MRISLKRDILILQSVKETWWKHLFAGSLAGVVSRTATAPLDRLKVFAQVTGKFYHPLKGLQNIIRKDGFLSLWRGNGINVVKIAPETGSKFLVYELTKVWMGAEQRTLSMGERFFAAGCAGVVSQTIIFPLEVLKTRMVIREGSTQPHTIRNVFGKLMRSKGYQGLFKGYFSTMGGIILFSGTDLCTYETTKLFLKRNFMNESDEFVPLPFILTCAVVACVTGQAVAYPLSMASTAVQASDQHILARNILHQRYKELGLYGWYRGSSMAYMKAVPAVCIAYLVYELTLKLLGTEMTL